MAFFATGDSIVSNNLVLNLYQHINAPEARMYLSRQLYEEALHVQFYLTLLDTYLPDHDERDGGVRGDREHPVDPGQGRVLLQVDRTRSSDLDRAATPPSDRKQFLLNLICFAACIEGLFFFAAFAYVYFLRSKGLLNGLAAGTNWVFRDESAHMNFAFEVIDTVRQEEPELFDDELEADRSREMIARPSSASTLFAADVLGEGVPGMSRRRHPRRTSVRRRPAPRPARLRQRVRLEEPVRLHGAAGRAGAVQLLRAHACRAYQVGVARRRRLRRRLLMFVLTWSAA